MPSVVCRSSRVRNVLSHERADIVLGDGLVKAPLHCGTVIRCVKVNDLAQLIIGTSHDVQAVLLSKRRHDRRRDGSLCDVIDRESYTNVVRGYPPLVLVELVDELTRALVSSTAIRVGHLSNMFRCCHMKAPFIW